MDVVPNVPSLRGNRGVTKKAAFKWVLVVITFMNCECTRFRCHNPSYGMCLTSDTWPSS